MRITRRADVTPLMPGPVPVPVFGWRARALTMLGDPAEYFMRHYTRFGPLSTWEPTGHKHVFAFGPAEVRAVFGEPDVFVADAFRAVRMPVDSAFHLLSNGLLRINGAEHRRHRKLMQPTFTPRRVLAHLDNVTELAEAMLAGWRVGERVELVHEFGRLIMLIAMRSVFDIDAPAEVDRLQGLISRLMRVAASPMTLMLPYDLPGTTMRTALRVCEQIEAVLRSVIRERTPTAAARTDMLSTMIAARDADGGGLTEDELVSEAYTAFCHDSSTATLTWALFLLDQHPEVLADLVDELRGELGGRAPDAAQLDRLPLLDAVLKETLRLLPPAPMLIRYTARDAELGSYRLPEGAMVFLSPYVTHRIPENFPDPLRFDPSRWAGATPSAFEYLPFGAGPHNCVGRHFALLEMKVVLALLLQRFRPGIVPGTPVHRAMRVSLVPGRGMPMTLSAAGSRGAVVRVEGTVRQSVLLP